MMRQIIWNNFCLHLFNRCCFWSLGNLCTFRNQKFVDIVDFFLNGWTFYWICRSQSHPRLQPKLHSCSFLVTHGPSMSNYGISISVGWSSHYRMRTSMEVGVALCVINFDRYSENQCHLEEIDYAKISTTSEKHISFLELQNSYSRTNKDKNCFDNFATSKIRWKLFPIYPVSVSS